MIYTQIHSICNLFKLPFHALIMGCTFWSLKSYFKESECYGNLLKGNLLKGSWGRSLHGNYPV